MAQPTAYQYVKLGANLEFLRGISTASIMQTTSLVAFPNLMDNLPARRYPVMPVLGVLKATLVQLEEMGLEQSLRAAEPFRPMLKDMEDYLAQVAEPERAYLNDVFAERLVALAKQLGSAVRTELGMMSAVPSPIGRGPG
jgi:hypothetical protein